jgi:DNA primase
MLYAIFSNSKSVIVKIEKFNFSYAKQIDLVEYLGKLGYQPVKIRNHDYWYLSPLRNEKAPSFKVNRKMNAWYDHGMGKGGDLIDFGRLYHQCTIKELLLRLENDNGSIVSFHQRPAGEKKEIIDTGGKIMVTDCRVISDPSLRKYLHERNIPLAIANRFCSEVDFELYSKKHTAIGFKNNAGGY